MSRGTGVELVLFALAAAFALFGFGVPRFDGDFEPGERPDGSIRVVTWNVGGRGGSGGHALSDRHVDRVRESLDALDADLVLLQEVAGRGQASRLAGGAPFETEAGRGRALAVIARRGTLRRVAVDRDAERPTLVLSYERDDGLAIHLADVHASAWSAVTRNRDIGRAVDLLLAGSGGRRAILAGDLNLEVQLDGRQDLFTNDSYVDLQTYNYVARSLVDVGLGAGPTAQPDRRIDYVFAVGLRRIRAGVWRGQRVGDMDHDPLVCDLAPE